MRPPPPAPPHTWLLALPPIARTMPAPLKVITSSQSAPPDGNMARGVAHRHPARRDQIKDRAKGQGGDIEGLVDRERAAARKGGGLAAHTEAAPTGIAEARGQGDRRVVVECAVDGRAQ